MNRILGGCSRGVRLRTLRFKTRDAKLPDVRRERLFDKVEAEWSTVDYANNNAFKLRLVYGLLVGAHFFFISL